jgi:GDP-4-dehydro-6-deoxy-D-mannose reductase
MRVLVTGANGFVGPYVVEAMRRELGCDTELVLTGKAGGQHALLGSVLPLDVTEGGAVSEAIAGIRPTHVLHLAAVAAPAVANAHPDETWRVHVLGTLNLARAILRQAPDCWLLNVGSGMVYGDSAKAGRLLDESTVLAPIDEYSASKAAADLALGALARQGLECIRLRPFNHAGPGQTEDFAIPAFAMQIARIEAGIVPPTIRVGNLDAQRDFLDVRDVASAYALAVKRAEQLQSGTILNIASGVPRRISDILYGLMRESRTAIAVEQDATRMRANDLAVFVGDASRARSLLGWEPRHPFDAMLAAVLDDARARTRTR